MSLADCLRLSDEVETAVSEGRPVVALESSVWCQGLPAPTGYQAALEAQDIVRAEGSVPAILALRDGVLQVGLSGPELEAMCAAGPAVVKTSLRELPLAVGLRQWGATTVSACLYMCQAAGIELFATGGIGGVHRGSHWDVSTDLPALGAYRVMVVCSGAKSLLDIPATLERLETEGVPVVGYQTRSFPVFYTRESRYSVSASVDEVNGLVDLLVAMRRMEWTRSILVAQPVPVADEIDAAGLEDLLDAAHQAAKQNGVEGKNLTPFILGYLHQHSGGRTLAANRSLLRENARLAARVAAAASRRS